jgi:hypothetical protein
MSEYQEILFILFDNKENLSDNDYLKLCNLLTKIKNKNIINENINNENDKIVKNILFSLEIFIIVILLLII